MIYIDNHVFDIIETPQKILKFKLVYDGEMGPYRLKDPDFPNDFSFSPDIAKAYRDTVFEILMMVTKKVYNKKAYMTDNHLESLEVLAKYYEFVDLIAWFERYWEMIDNVAFTNRFISENRLRPEEEVKNRMLIKAFKEEIEIDDIYPELKISKINYLKDQNTNLSSSLSELKLKIQKMIDKDTDSFWIEHFKKVSKYDKIKNKILSNKIRINHLKGREQDKIIITDDMIDIAKRVPFNKILKLEIIGGRERTLCPFHNEKTPSFIVYPDTNRGHCHGCGRNVDTIQYLVEIKKIKFNEAVLMLLEY